MNKKLSIIIVSYNSEDFINKCISSVLENLPKDSEVIVVDNASSDSTAQILKKFVPRIQLITSGKNLGFSKACNLGVKQAKGDFLFFLNPDTQLDTNIFDSMIVFYEKVDAGIVAPKLIRPDGSVQPSALNLPTLGRAFSEYILGIKHAYSEYIPQIQEPQEVAAVYGAALLIKNDFFNKIGGFDEKYFLYYEDIDLCRKIHLAGKKIYYFPQVSLNHLVGATKSELDKSKLNNDSFVKYHGFLSAFLLTLIFQVPRIKRKLSGIFLF